jgi:hypothetical protein
MEFRIHSTHNHIAIHNSDYYTCNILFYISGGLELFKGLLKSEFSEENVEFWITCEEFRCSGDANMQVFAQKIYGVHNSDYYTVQSIK